MPFTPRARSRAFEIHGELMRIYKIISNGHLYTTQPSSNGRLEELLIKSRGSGPSAALTNGKYLDIEVTLRERPGEDFVEVSRATFTYSEDEDGDDEIFSYHYVRDDYTKYPRSHVHIEQSHLHVPTRRISLEQVVWYLKNDHGVDVHDDLKKNNEWHRILWNSERKFCNIQKLRDWPYDVPFPPPNRGSP